MLPYLETQKTQSREGCYLPLCVYVLLYDFIPDATCTGSASEPDAILTESASEKTTCYIVLLHFFRAEISYPHILTCFVL